MAEIRYEHVSKSFDANKVVDDFDLRIADGELMVLVGPSGCGKTTALRMLAGLEEADSGQIVIDEQIVNDLEPRERDVAMVFQNYALYPHLSVYQNMAFGLRLHHVGKDEIDRRVREAAHVLQLEELLQRKPKQLSGGQRQRVAMGRAIVRQPKVFLMDEPLSNLDAKLRVQMRAQIARLQRDLAVTMLYVTHDQVEAMTLGRRVAVMRLGALQQVAPPQELYGRPVNLFVASFIGSPAMNVVELPLSDGGAAAAGYTVPLTSDVLAKANAESLKSVTVGFRPEDLVLSEDGTGMPVLVNIVEELGADAYVYGELVLTGNERKEIIMRTDGRRPPGKGEVIHATVKPGHSHVFSPATGLRLS